MKYEFSKPFCPPTKTDIGSDEEWATEPDITLQKKVCIKVSFEYFDYINVFLIYLLYYSIAETLDDLQTITSETKPTLPSIDKTLTALSIGPITKIKN